jgi:peptide deformylase
MIDKMMSYVNCSQNQEHRRKYGLREAIGIAAPQLGYNKKMFYISVPIFNKTQKYFLINPKINATSENMCILENGEGCLSVASKSQKYQGYVPRHFKITVSGYDFLQKKNINIAASGILSIVLQHELDHLFGKLFFDRINHKEP